MKMSEDTKRKLSIINTGKHLSEEIKQRIHLSMKGKNLGRHLSEETKEKIRQARLGIRNSDKSKKKVSESLRGHIVSEETRRKISLGHKGKSYILSEISMQKIKNGAKKRIIPKEKILEDYISLVKKNGILTKSEYKKLAMCSVVTIAAKFGSLDNLAKEANIAWVQPQNDRTLRGKNEDKILDIIEQHNNIKLERQFRVNHYHIDGFDIINNIAYEVDEFHHRGRYVQDVIRENKIKEKLKCNFVRINEEDFLQNLENQSLENFSEGVKNDE